MDLTKFFLYTSLAVITYLMLLAWQEDYPPVVNDGSQQASQLQIPESASAPVTDVPSNVPNDVPTERCQALIQTAGLKQLLARQL